jgi:glutamine synthetase
MLDALSAFDKDKSLKDAMGEEFSAAFLKLKHQEWNSASSRLFDVGTRKHARHLKTVGFRPPKA